MSGFRKAMPFTFACMVIGGLALSGFPPFSGFFSKDDIIATELSEGNWHVVLGIAGYVGSLLTAIYTFRMIFRAFFGDPCPEALELEHGHLHHVDVPTNPATGEQEDTDVGFPGPEHLIAEREWPMKAAMGALAVLAIIGGLIQIPHVTNGLRSFLEPAFADSRAYQQFEPSGSLTVIGLIVGAALSLLGVLIAYALYVRHPERPAVLQARAGFLHRLFVNKWYFDEAIDLLVTRPWGWTGRFAASTIERVVVSGALVGGASGLVRAAGSAVRAGQSGYLRYYAALLLVGLTGLGAYFLISA
jgi:NADH-quinone oxidoreductase subunit L